MNRRQRVLAAAAAVAVLAAGLHGGDAYGAAHALPRPDHVVIVMLENKRFDSVIGNAKTPWVNALAAKSALMTGFYAETHPSQPNYLALFSGSTQGVTDNNCPHELGNRPNLGRQLLGTGRTFAGYAEDLPSVGFPRVLVDQVRTAAQPWVNFSNVPASANRPYTAFPRDYRRLPTLAFVIPNLCHDMHDCPKDQADAWLRTQFQPYVTWATTHNSLFVVTFDEDNRTGGNRIATVVAGAGVRPGQYPQRLSHYDLLYSLQAMYGLPHFAMAARGLPAMWTVG